MLKAAQGRRGAKVGKEGEAGGKHVLDVQFGQIIWEELSNAIESGLECLENKALG